jgi:hypothetical protein
MLEGQSKSEYISLKNKVELWLQQNNIDYFVPGVLRSEFYNDASHPTSQGYKILAEEIFENESFKMFFQK